MATTVLYAQYYHLYHEPDLKLKTFFELPFS